MSILKMFGNKKPDRPVNSDMDKQRKYEALVRAYHRDLFRYAYWLCKDKSVAEDLVQETCLRAWKSLDSLQDEKAAKSWLITILRRENARRFERKQLDLVDIDDHGHDAKINDDPHHQQVYKLYWAVYRRFYCECRLAWHQFVCLRTSSAHRVAPQGHSAQHRE